VRLQVSADIALALDVAHRVPSSVDSIAWERQAALVDESTRKHRPSARSRVAPRVSFAGRVPEGVLLFVLVSVLLFVLLSVLLFVLPILVPCLTFDMPPVTTGQEEDLGTPAGRLDLGSFAFKVPASPSCAPR
jgi:hypothetical protein